MLILDDLKTEQREEHLKHMKTIYETYKFQTFT